MRGGTDEDVYGVDGGEMMNNNPKTDLMTEIISLRFKPNSKNNVELYLNNGWSFSFIIQNASTIDEPSLKFDIQFLGVPCKYYNC